MPVVNFEDYRAPQKSGPCTVTFLGFAYRTPEGPDGRINLSITVADGDFAGVIEAVKQSGGAYLPSQDGGKTILFLPWPCAAVRISVVQAGG